MEAFLSLKPALCSEPLVDYPRKNRPSSLIVVACTGNEKNIGGMEEILCQTDEKRQRESDSLCKQTISKTQKNYPPFLVKMAAMTCTIEHFNTYLKGRHL